MVFCTLTQAGSSEVGVAAGKQQNNRQLHDLFVCWQRDRLRVHPLVYRGGALTGLCASRGPPWVSRPGQPPEKTKTTNGRFWRPQEK